MRHFLTSFLHAVQLSIVLLCGAWFWAESRAWIQRRRLPSPEQGKEQFEKLYVADAEGNVEAAIKYAEGLGMSTYLHPQLLCGRQVGGRTVYHYLEQQRRGRFP